MRNDNVNFEDTISVGYKTYGKLASNWFATISIKTRERLLWCLSLCSRLIDIEFGLSKCCVRLNWGLNLRLKTANSQGRKARQAKPKANKQNWETNWAHAGHQQMQRKEQFIENWLIGRVWNWRTDARPETIAVWHWKQEMQNNYWQNLKITEPLFSIPQTQTQTNIHRRKRATDRLADNAPTNQWCKSIYSPLATHSSTTLRSLPRTPWKPLRRATSMSDWVWMQWKQK